MNTDSDEECTADYGPFGSNACQCPACQPRIPTRDLNREKMDRMNRERREQNERTSRAFNSHMIQLFNEGQRK